MAFIWLGQAPGTLELAGGGIALAGGALASSRSWHPGPATGVTSPRARSV